MLHRKEFPSFLHHIIFYVSETVIFPLTWSFNRLVSLFIPTTKEQQKPWKIMFKRILLSPVYFIIVLICSAPAIIGFLFRNVLHLSRSSYIFSFKKSTRPSSQEGAASSISIATMNVCLLPEVLSRINNLSDASHRASAIGARVVIDQFHYENMTSAHQETNEKSVSKTKAPGYNPAFIQGIVTHFPKLDFICLQETWSRALTRPLIKELHKVFPWILHSVGATSYNSNRFLLNSGLMFASRYRILDADFRWFKNSCNQCVYSSKGLLMVKVCIDLI